MDFRLALLSDQHGNDTAFRAVLDAVERLGVDDIVCLGDVAQGGDEPVRTLDRLAALGCETVLGNADAFLLEVPTDSNEPVTEQQLERREWTLSQLDDSHLEKIRSFVPVVHRELGGVRMLFFHGSPRFYEDVLLPESGEDALAPFLGHDAALLAGATRTSSGRGRSATRSMSIPAASACPGTVTPTRPRSARSRNGRSSRCRTASSRSSSARSRTN